MDSIRNSTMKLLASPLSAVTELFNRLINQEFMRLIVQNRRIRGYAQLQQRTRPDTVQYKTKLNGGCSKCTRETNVLLSGTGRQALELDTSPVSHSLSAGQRPWAPRFYGPQTILQIFQLGCYTLNSHSTQQVTNCETLH